MIPLKLTIQGIYSYQEEQTIDFSELMQARLFGLFGPTGCGKSSILEAITFCLYQRLERLNKTDRINYSLMNLKSRQFLIDFTFLSSYQKKGEYRFIVTGKRKKDFHEVEIKNKQYIKKEEQWIPLTANTQDIIGLDYDHFKRTVIIPQGKFQDFLLLTSARRTDMLKDIFKLHQYDLFSKSSLLYQRYHNQLLQIDGRLQELAHIQQEQIKENKSELSGLKKKSGQLGQEKKVLLEQEKEYSQVKAVFEKLSRYQNQANQLLPQEDFYLEARQRLAQYEKCYYLFFHLINQKKEVIREYEGVEKQLSLKKNESQKLGLTLSQLNEKFDQVKVKYEKIEQIKDEIDENKSALKILALQARINEIQVQKNSRQQEIEAVKENKQVNEKKIKDLKSAMKGKHVSTRELNLLSILKEKFQLKINCETEIKALQAKQAQYKQTVNAIVKQVSHKLLQNFPDQSDFETLLKERHFKEIQTRLGRENEQLNCRLSENEEQLTDLKLKDKLKQFTEQLVSGQACPLCGAREHPCRLNVADVENDLIQLSDLKEKYTEEKNRVVQLFHMLEKENDRLEMISASQDEVQEQIKEQKKQIRQIWESHGHDLEKYRHISQLNQLIAQKQANYTQLEQIAMDKEQLADELSSQNNLLFQLADQFNQISQELSGEKKLKEDYLKKIDWKTYQDQSEAYIKQTITKLSASIDLIQEQYARLETELKQEQKKQSIIEGEINNLTQNRNNIREKQKIILEKIENQLQKSDYDKIEAIEKVLSDQIDIEGERAKISRYFDQINSIRSQITLLTREMGARDYDQAQHTALLSKIEAMNREIETANNKISVLNHLQQELKEKLKTKKTLQAQKKKLSQKLEDINALKNLFKGRKFVNYISTLFLRNLCHAANNRFYHLTRKNLKLTINKNNDFEIIDFLNEGKTRSIKTLSGGQIFQASLCLALALTDHFQSINQMQEHFFFLDEGFGSLDSASLQIVFETLRQLPRENRIVGIISHVEELKQNIDYYLQIKHDREKGSLIQASWQV